jgi:hypothetical protein
VIAQIDQLTVGITADTGDQVTVYPQDAGPDDLAGVDVK